MSLVTKRAIGLTAAAIVAATIVSRGQAPAIAPAAPAVGEVTVNTGYVLRMILQDQDKAIAFYADLLKLTMPPAPATPRVPANSATIAAMVGVPETVKVRFVTPRIPGSDFGVELEEFTEIDRTMMNPRPQDPGGVTLVLLVRDLAAAFAPLKQAGVRVVTPGGGPAALGKPMARGVLVSDGQGHFVELLQPDPPTTTTAPAESNVIGARVRLTVIDTAQSIRFYRDALRIPVEPGAFGSDQAAVLGLKPEQVRVSIGQFPGSPTALELLEVKGTPRTPIKPHPQDPGAIRLSMRVRDLDTAVSKVNAAGATIMSAGDITATVNGARRRVVVSDPNGIFVQLDPLPTPSVAQGQRGGAGAAGPRPN
ncbi:MAG TPA: VOC family protein [Planctomycetaceae bacterium]|jgi:catechol 2,3-dioxygenase-like lactoylglutathione lyase family enzyme|nr:VOC family protein [Planctomycetaceae bacterium]